MKKFDRRVLPVAVSALALGVAACGGGDSGSSSSNSSSSSSSGGGKEGGTITALTGTAPDYLDPHEGYTTQSAEVTWISYTPLLTYKHAKGEEGGQLIPGLAEGLPKLSNNDKTYTLQLRKGLKYSNGKPVKPEDFEYSIERMLRVNWGGKSFVTNYVKGAAAYDKKKAKDISGITSTPDGKITIQLDKPYGAFSNVLAFPSLALVPSGTPMKDLSSNPPAGVGPYMLTDVTPNQGYTLKKNPDFASFKIPDIPTGHLDTINFKILSNTQTEAQQVLDNQADVFDFGDTLPASLLSQIQSQAKDRFAKQIVPSTFYMFLNTQKPPFNNEKARQAVNAGVDRRGFVKLASGFLEPECFFIPKGIVGHPEGECPHGSKDGAPDLAKAKQLVKESGQANTKIVVWGERRAPRTEYVEYYADQLKKIGFKNVDLKIINDETYFPTIGNEKTDPQTGFADWIQDFPNPSDFYLLLNADSIQPTNNQNFSKTDDPKLQSELKALDATPATELDSVADRWQKLDEYVADKAYVYVYGSETLPQFFSNKIDFASAIFHPTYGNDFTSLRLK